MLQTGKVGVAESNAENYGCTFKNILCLLQ